MDNVIVVLVVVFLIIGLVAFITKGKRNEIIVNGRVISGSTTAKVQKFDEIKKEDCNNVEKITIYSAFANVNVSVSNSPTAEAHLYGEATVDGDVNFDVQIVNRELRITLDYTGNCFNVNLKLDITVPQKTFKVISAKSLSADITLNKGVTTDYLKVKTGSGNLETDATINNVSASTMSGGVNLCIDAKQDINVEVSTMSGNVSAEFNNIGNINLSSKSMSGKVQNRHNEGEGYTADVDISTMSGNIRIR